MGLSTKNANGTFLGIREGKIVMRVTEPTDTSKSRPKKGEETVIINEEFFDSLEGHIVGLKVVENEYDKEIYKSWLVVINDNGTDYMLKVSQNSRYGSGLMSRIENVDFSKPVEIVTYWIKQDDGKHRGYLNIKQDGKKIEQKYTKDIPNGLPPLESTVFRGKKLWDSDNQIRFYEAIMNRLAPILIAANAAKNDIEKPVQAKTSEALPVKQGSKNVPLDNDAPKEYTDYSNVEKEVPMDDDLPF